MRRFPRLGFVLWTCSPLAACGDGGGKSTGDGSFGSSMTSPGGATTTGGNGDTTTAPGGTSTITTEDSSGDGGPAPTSGGTSKDPVTSTTTGSTGEDGGTSTTMAGCAAPLVECGGSCVDVLTDANHCETCEHSCLGGGCANGVCSPLVLAQGLSPADSLALDATHVYIGSSEGLVRVPKMGGAKQVLAGDAVSPFSVVVADDQVFFARAGAALRVPADGSAQPVVLASFGQLGNRGLALDAQRVYVTLTDFNMNPPTSTVAAVSRMGGAPVTLTGGLINATTLSVLGAEAFVATGTYSGKLYKVPTNGGDAVTLADYGTDLYFVAARPTGVYMANCFKGTVTRVPLGGGAETAMATTVCPYAIAFDEDHLYFTEPINPGGVSRVPLAGGDPEKLADEPWSLAIAVDEKAIYFTSYMTGTLFKLAK